VMCINLGMSSIGAHTPRPYVCGSHIDATVSPNDYRLDRSVDPRVGRHQNDLTCWIDVADGPEYIKSIDVRHPEIDDDHFGLERPAVLRGPPAASVRLTTLNPKRRAKLSTTANMPGSSSIASSVGSVFIARRWNRRGRQLIHERQSDTRRLVHVLDVRSPWVVAFTIGQKQLGEPEDDPELVFQIVHDPVGRGFQVLHNSSSFATGTVGASSGVRLACFASVALAVGRQSLPESSFSA